MSAILARCGEVVGRFWLSMLAGALFLGCPLMGLAGSLLVGFVVGDLIGGVAGFVAMLVIAFIVGLFLSVYVWTHVSATVAKAVDVLHHG